MINAMAITPAILLLLQGATEPCPGALEFRSDYGPAAVQAEVYAQCIGANGLPSAAELPARLAACEGERTVSAAARYQPQAFDWVDRMAARYPGCAVPIHVKAR